MKDKMYLNRNRGASIVLVILAVLGLIFLVQLMGVNVRTSWPIIAIVFIAMLVWGGGKS